MDIFAAKAREQEQWRRIGRPQQIFKQRRTAVGIGPLQIVDVKHQRLPVRYAPEQFAQRRKRFASQREWIRNLLLALRRIENRINLKHHRKKTSERQDFARHQCFSFRLGKGEQILR